jgi:hypothetical protein
MPRMNDRPSASIALWLASEIMPASATTVASGSRWAAMNALTTGSIVLVSINEAIVWLEQHKLITVENRAGQPMIRERGTCQVTAFRVRSCRTASGVTQGAKMPSAEASGMIPESGPKRPQ